MKTINLALIGKNIGHSRSPELYRKYLSNPHTYTLIDIQHDDQLPSLKELSEKFNGINITTPYKKSYLGQVELVEGLKGVESINCLRFENGKAIATNTDYFALEKLFDDYELHLKCSLRVVLGGGTMAELITKILRDRGMTYQQFTRGQHGSLNDLDYISLPEEHGQDLSIINCCSRDFVFSSPIPTGTFFWDLNYDLPAHRSLATSCTYVDGFSLLEKQALLAIEHWVF
jgi:shikimate dehydrogenase